MPSLIKKKSKGFVSLYFVLILSLLVVTTAYLTESMQGYLYYYSNLSTFRRMNNVEVLVCRRLMYLYRNYKEKDERFIYEDFLVEIEIHGRKAFITIQGEGLVRERVFVYDEENDVTEKYY